MSNQVEEKIIEYLGKHSFCSLATVDGERPHASTVEYVNDGIKLYVVSFPGTRKVKNLAGSPSVAITVHSEKYEHRKYRGVQCSGKATLLTDPEQVERVRSLFFDKYMTNEAIHWNRAKVVFYAIEPERIDYIDYSVGFGHRETWTGN